MTRKELLEKIDIDEMMDWWAYFSMEPRGEERNDWNAALIGSVFANCNLAKGAKPITPRELLLKFEKPRKQTSEEQMEIIKSIQTRIEEKKNG